MYLHLLVNESKHSKSFALVKSSKPKLTQQEMCDIFDEEVEEYDESFGRGVRLVDTKEDNSEDVTIFWDW